ncbi:MAG: hypothetical protein Q9226_006729 [Calogaya cf. arnoldii]
MAMPASQTNPTAMEATIVYEIPTALTILAGIFLALGAICPVIPIVDIVWRKGWKSMIHYGPSTQHTLALYHSTCTSGTVDLRVPVKEERVATTMANMVTVTRKTTACLHRLIPKRPPRRRQLVVQKNCTTIMLWAATVQCGPRSPSASPTAAPAASSAISSANGSSTATSTTINNRAIWPELLIDYAFAILFGIVFQYFSIAPMSGDYSARTMIRALKADILSLTSFEIGLFGWMIAYQVGIWGYRLEMNTWVYWWMMQVGMFFGFGRRCRSTGG